MMTLAPSSALQRSATYSVVTWSSGLGFARWKLVFSLQEIYPGQFLPSPSHRFIAALERRNKLLRNYSQNIDTLEQAAGISRVVYCHGTGGLLLKQKVTVAVETVLCFHMQDHSQLPRAHDVDIELTVSPSDKTS